MITAFAMLEVLPLSSYTKHSARACEKAASPVQLVGGEGTGETKKLL